MCLSTTGVRAQVGPYLTRRRSSGLALLSSVLVVAATSCCDTETRPKHKKNMFGTASVTATVKGKTTSLTRAIVDTHSEKGSNSSFVSLKLGTSSLSCDHSSSEDAEISIDITPGPGKKYYVGSKIPVEVAGALEPSTNNEHYFSLADFEASLTMEFVSMKPGGHVRGRLDLQGLGPQPATGGGTFDAVACEDIQRIEDMKSDTWNLLPEQAPPGPVAGKAMQMPFEAKSASIWVGDNPATNGADGSKYMYKMCLMPVANAGCNCPGEGTSFPDGIEINTSFFRGHLSGTYGARAVVGSTIPLPGRHVVTHGARTITTDENSWVHWDSMSFNAKDVVRGALAIASSDMSYSGPEFFVNVAGHFEATVCGGSDPSPAHPSSTSSAPGHRPRPGPLVRPVK